jgi:hypothetical protein
VRRERFGGLDAALAEIEREAVGLAEGADATVVKPPLMREFQPVHQVLARIELSGPGGVRAGVDVRGDGSTEAFTGRLRRRLIDQKGHETAVQALRRTLSGQ